MSRVDFIVADDDVTLDRLRMVCAVAEQFCLKRRRVAVMVGAPAERQMLSALLWTYSDISFLAHDEEVSQPGSVAPILLLDNGSATSRSAECDCVINAGERVAANDDHPPHIIEVVTSDPEMKQAARERYRAYQAGGHEMRTLRVRSYADIKI